MTTTAAPAQLLIRDLTVEFEARKQKTLALDRVEMHLGVGELVCMVGASGSGKSTLLNVIAGLLPSTSGDVLFEDEPVIGPGPDRGMIFQSYSLYPWRTVAQNVAFGLEVMGASRSDTKKQVDYYLDVMKLTKWADARPSQLSGGMRQRVAIARSLATRPRLLLMDEPFGALDAHTKSQMQDFLLSIWRRTETSILMVTHDVEEAIYLSQRIYVLSSHPGRVKAEIRVPFPDERDNQTRRDPRFLDLREEIQQMLLDEVSEV